ncbi:uncharacterized protein CLUP02_12474 [Colletotrichum lupini]|uniref:Uncharacterized protein n=1 Tax=Colletotrichum lupini TaxID=145971 RepID=A0A9Q8T2A8_9PEZI|nr:uncharacterized protein CLUP02_12474 [Colletotrichum lupini]UQC86972.1 hypothetical protein CLUP02_12474 [Colletotrichum lupini]
MAYCIPPSCVASHAAEKGSKTIGSSWVADAASDLPGFPIGLAAWDSHGNRPHELQKEL